MSKKPRNRNNRPASHVPRPASPESAARPLAKPRNGDAGRGTFQASAGPRISACMITKNEEANIERCLRAVGTMVDEVVVVDTGSTDRTVEIAERCGARVEHFAWCDHFARARNASLKHASGDWVVWIDADEELIESQPGTLRELCRRLPDSAHGCLVECRNVCNEQGDFSTVIRQWRLFRNHVGIHFEGRIHEHLLLANGGRDVNLASQDEVWIRHWGYMPTGDLLTRKRGRNLPLLEMAAAEEPDEPFHHYNLAKQYYAANQYAEARPHVQKAVGLWFAQGEVDFAYSGHMLGMAMASLHETGDYQGVLALEARLPARHVSAETLLQAGLARWRLGDLAGATERLERAVDRPRSALDIEIDPGASTWRPLIALAQIHVDLGHLDQAYALASKALEYGPDRPSVLFPLAFIAGRRGALDDCIRWSRSVLRGERDEGYKAQARRLLLNIAAQRDDPAMTLEATTGEVSGIAPEDAALRRARAHARLGNLQSRYDELDAACRDHPENEDIRLELSQTLEDQGFVSQALNVLAAGVDQPNASPMLYRRLAMILAKQGKLEDAANALTVAEKLRAERQTAELARV
ncbi:MAG: glycosyltransferase [Chloroflexota bacterium]